VPSKNIDTRKVDMVVPWNPAAKTYQEYVITE